ncbi:MAG: ATP-binding protein [Planctomycetes bacterium]|nr:ATP-binding protein [Planctomycetota bacterium]
MVTIPRLSYIKKLQAWKDSPRRKPLILEGARQVGKTWLMRDFATSHFKNAVYVRFDKDQQLRAIFKRDFDVARIVHELEIAFKARVTDGETVLLFDEIQACKDAITALKYFCEDRPSLHVIAAGSLLGLEYRDDAAGAESGNDGEGTTGFPVGKVNALAVRPLTFVEFVRAVDSDALAAQIEARDWGLLADFRERLEDLLKHYFVIGGMPEAVATYLDTRNFIDVAQVHKEIISGYARDFAKHAPKKDVPRVAMAWASLPAQLARENKKFSYALIKRGERGANYREPLSWLQGAGLVHLCRRAKKPGIPLSAYADAAFKAYALDVGVLAAMSSLDSAVVLQGARVFTEFKGALTEQYVHQQLIARDAGAPFYWSTDDSRTEVDFLVQEGMGVAPIEVKAAENVKAKSLKSYIERFKPQKAYRYSLKGHQEDSIPLEGGGVCCLVNVPLYAI